MLFLVPTPRATELELMNVLSKGSGSLVHLPLCAMRESLVDLAEAGKGFGFRRCDQRGRHGRKGRL